MKKWSWKNSFELQSEVMGKVIIAAGGSGGHLFPAESLALLLQEQHEVLIAGHNVERNPFLDAQIHSKNISAAAPKKGNYFRFLFSTFRGFFQSIRLLYRFSPDVVVGFGSYHTFPLMLAATLLRKKMVLFEANCILGKVNRLFVPFASLVGLQFPLPKKLKKSLLVKPLTLRKQEPSPAKKEALSYFGLNADTPIILVFGGSQGAKVFNEMMPEALRDLDVQVIHLTGKGGVVYQNRAYVKSFEKRMDLAYTAADLVISRSGAATISELIAYQKPSLLIPYPFAAEQHQLKNAQFLSDTVCGSRVLPQSLASISKIREEIKELFAGLSGYEAQLRDYSMDSRSDFVKVIEQVMNG